MGAVVAELAVTTESIVIVSIATPPLGCRSEPHAQVAESNAKPTPVVRSGFVRRRPRAIRASKSKKPSPAARPIPGLVVATVQLAQPPPLGGWVSSVVSAAAGDGETGSAGVGVANAATSSGASAVTSTTREHAVIVSSLERR
jgi:hypothetical protein